MDGDDPRPKKKKPTSGLYNANFGSYINAHVNDTDFRDAHGCPASSPDCKMFRAKRGLEISSGYWVRGVNKRGVDTEIDARVEIDEDAYEAVLEEQPTFEEQRSSKQTTPSLLLFQWY